MLKRLSLALLLLAGPLTAQHLDDRLSDPVQELRARELSRELRCLVCQNQSIEDSNAPLARDLRRIVRERVEAGDSDRAILDFLVTRYGEWVLLKPRFNVQTWLLWLGPVVMLLVGGGIIAAMYRRQRRTATPAVAALDAAEQKRLADLLKNEEPR